MDAARAGLGEALRRRVTVAERVADALGPAGAPLRTAARTAGAGDAPTPDGRDPAGSRQAREAAENVLTRELAAVATARIGTSLVDELADAQQLVILARRVHNDAVRDTLDLRSRRLVRWLRLAGTAPAQAYFEIADPRRDPAPQPAAPQPAAPQPAAPRSA